MEQNSFIKSILELEKGITELSIIPFFFAGVAECEVKSPGTLFP
jgi:hypothetical protein